MMIREPAVAGMFYARQREQCLTELRACLDRAATEVGPDGGAADSREVVGGIAPHAGWVYSGVVVAHVFRKIADCRQPGVVVLFGAVHVVHGSQASVFPSGAWETPLGLASVDARLVERLQGQTGLLEAAPHAHEREHSIEVLVPFVQYLMPGASIVPILVPAGDKAAAVGQAVGRTCKDYGVDAVFVGSSDLTHYGPSYGFAPEGVGAGGLAWAKDVNDRRMIDLILAMREEEVVEEAVAHQNACGAGAVAAAIAACKAYGAKRATLLEHTTSFEVLSTFRAEPMRDAVGYAGILFD